jgi:hypothetical protein
MITWINRTTKVQLKEKCIILYNIDNDYYDSKLEEIETIKTNGEIILSNQTIWSLSDFTLALEKRELEMVCECLTCLVKLPNFHLSFLGCPTCK